MLLRIYLVGALITAILTQAMTGLDGGQCLRAGIAWPVVAYCAIALGPTSCPALATYIRNGTPILEQGN